MINKKSIIIARDIEHLQELIKEEIKKNGNEYDLNFIDTSQIENMSYLFFNSNFNGNISKWNTSKVKNMTHMFSYSKFNGDISQWNNSNVKDMSYMFYNSNFNNDIEQWNIYNVKNIENIFLNSQSQNIPYWAKIKKFKERQKAYIAYHAQKEKELIENNLQNNFNTNIQKEVFKI